MNYRGLIYIPSNGLWTERDHQRYGLDFFEEKKVDCLVITTLNQKKHFDYLLSSNNKKEIKHFLKDKKSINVIILGGCHFFKQFWLLKFLKENKLPWSLQLFNTIPETYNLNRPLVFQIKKTIKIILNRIAIKIFNIGYPKVIFTSSKKSELTNFVFYNFEASYVEIPDEGYSNLIFDMGSITKDITDISKKNYSIEDIKDSLIFIDEGGTNHPDQYVVKKYDGFFGEDYYDEVKKSLKKISSILSKKVFVAAHPSSNYKNDRFGDIPIFEGLTLELIKNCSMSVVHKSTALNLSVLFKKPILFLSSQFSSSKYLKNKLKLAHIFGKTPITYEHLSKNYSLERAIAYPKDFEFYRDYLNKTSFNKQSHEIIYENLWKENDNY